VADIREATCPRHGRRVELVPWAHPAARHTHAFDRQIAALVQVADKSAAERMFRVSWRTVGRMVERVVGELLPSDRLSGLRAITIDETSHKRGHRYLTVVSCAVKGRVVWIGEGKSADSLRPFFDELGQARCRDLEVVAMDMNGAYRKVVEERAPQADIVYDRFHVVQLLMRAIDEVRREECRGLEGDDRRALKNTRFALLRNPRHRTPKDRQAIARVQATNSLYRAYQLRIDFEELWSCDTEEQARSFVDRWTKAALRSRREPLKRFARTLRDHVNGILGFFRHDGLTSAVAEGLNNKIKLVIHRAFGFADLSALMSMVYLCCGGLEVPLG
jgi:transposase